MLQLLDQKVLLKEILKILRLLPVINSFRTEQTHKLGHAFRAAVSVPSNTSPVKGK